MYSEGIARHSNIMQKFSDLFFTTGQALHTLSYYYLPRKLLAWEGGQDSNLISEKPEFKRNELLVTLKLHSGRVVETVPELSASRTESFQAQYSFFSDSITSNKE